MQSFNFFSPTEVVFGKGAEAQVGVETAKFGGTRVLVIYGGGSVVKSSLLDKVCKSLDEERIEYITMGGVVPNPKASFVREATKKAIEFKADFILAVGGGSVIDTAKAVAHCSANPDVDVWDFWSRKTTVLSSLPHGCVLTISAAGSEMSNSSVITNDETNEKRGINTEFNRPKFAIMNPELTYTLPAYQVSCGIADIMMHTLERFFTVTKNNMLTDEFAIALLRTLITNAKVAVKNSHDYEAMSEIMWCGSVSHNGMTGLGAVADFTVHQFGHEISGMFDTAHGASLTTVWGSWAKYCVDDNVSRFAQYGQSVWGINTGDEKQDAMLGIEKTVEFFKSINMPVCFNDLEVGLQTKEKIHELADCCVFHGARTIGTFKNLNKDDVEAIYTMANTII